MMLPALAQHQADATRGSYTEGRGLKFIPNGMAVKRDAKYSSTRSNSFDMAVKQVNPAFRVETHRLDEVEVAGISHKASLGQALVPIFAPPLNICQVTWLPWNVAGPPTSKPTLRPRG